MDFKHRQLRVVDKQVFRLGLAANYGIDVERLSAEGAGMTQPVDTNDTDEGRAKNRRVELVKQ